MNKAFSFITNLVNHAYTHILPKPATEYAKASIYSSFKLSKDLTLDNIFPLLKLLSAGVKALWQHGKILLRDLNLNEKDVQSEAELKYRNTQLSIDNSEFQNLKTQAQEAGATILSNFGNAAYEGAAISLNVTAALTILSVETAKYVIPSVQNAVSPLFLPAFNKSFHSPIKEIELAEIASTPLSSVALG